MAKQVQLRRGSASDHTTFTGAVGELTYVSDDKTLRIHDGATAGGIDVGTGVINVKNYGATGDGSTDDTAAIQAALDAAYTAGETVYVPTGTYMINALAVASPTAHGLTVKSGVALELSPSAIIKSIPNSSPGACVIGIYNQTGVLIRGGTIEGDRTTHTGTTGEWGHCIDIRGSSDVTVAEVKCIDAWGDNLYIGHGFSPEVECSDITVRGCLFMTGRRNNCSIVSADGVNITSSVFHGAAGTRPEVGIDIEPNAGKPAWNITVTGCHFDSNGAAGLRVEGSNSSAYYITVTGNTFNNNCVGLYADTAELIGKNTNACTFIGNAISQGNMQGIRLSDLTRSTVSGNSIYVTEREGIAAVTCDGINISNNTIHQSGMLTNDTYSAIYLDDVTDSIVKGNLVELGGTGNNHKYGIELTALPVSDNTNIVANNVLRAVTASLSDGNTSTTYSKNQPIWKTIFTDADTTPSVLGVEFGSFANTGSTSVTALDDGRVGQELTLRLDINTTIVHDGSRLRLVGSADYSGDANSVIRLLCITGGASSAFTEISRGS